MKQFHLGRSDAEIGRAVHSESSDSFVYVYVKYEDRTDVFKFSRAEIVAHDRGSDLLATAKPCYRVQAGECTCDGYTYRGKCRHASYVAAVTTSGGWLSAAK